MGYSSCNKPYTSRDKWIVALVAAVLFLILASPFTYSLLNGLTSSFGLITAAPNGCPLMSGLIIMAILYMLVVRLLMR